MTDVLETAETASVPERFHEDLYPDLLHFLRVDLSKGFRENVPVTSRRQCLEVARLQRDLARTLALFSEIPEEEQKRSNWQGVLRGTIFSERNPDSIINCLGGKNEKERVENRQIIDKVLIGPISILTFAGLLRGIPGFENVKVSQIVASPYEDVAEKCDLIIRLSENEAYLVQLKSSRSGKFRIVNIPKEGAYSDEYYGLRQGDTVRIQEKMNKLENRGIKTKAFVVEMPAIDSQEVGGNVYGRIKPKFQWEVSENFREQAENQGFL